jgi:uridine kinase
MTSNEFIKYLEDYQNKNVLIIVRGISGSGKSTLKDRIVDTFDYAYCEADDYFTDEDGVYKFNPAKLSQAHQWCKKVILSLLKQGINCIVSNTATKLWEFSDYITMAESYGYSVIIVRKENSYGSIHNVPVEVINNQLKRFEDYPYEIIVKD